VHSHKFTILPCSQKQENKPLKPESMTIARKINTKIKQITSMKLELEGEPDHARNHLPPSSAIDLSSRPRIGGKWKPPFSLSRPLCRVWMRNRGSETKQLSTPATNLTSTSIRALSRGCSLDSRAEYTKRNYFEKEKE
jgi:hypothetical protein